MGQGNPIKDTCNTIRSIQKYEDDWLDRILKISTSKQKILNMLRLNLVN